MSEVKKQYWIFKYPIVEPLSLNGHRLCENYLSFVSLNKRGYRVNREISPKTFELLNKVFTIVSEKQNKIKRSLKGQKFWGNSQFLKEIFRQWNCFLGVCYSHKEEDILIDSSYLWYWNIFMYCCYGSQSIQSFESKSNKLEINELIKLMCIPQPINLLSSKTRIHN